MKDENSVPAAQKMTDLFLPIFRSKFRKRRIQKIDDSDTYFRKVSWVYNLLYVGSPLGVPVIP